MASGKCTYLKQALGDFILGGASFTPPSTLWVALSTLPFDSTTTGATILASEPASNTGYVRVSVVNNLTFWSATDTSGNKSNQTNVAFANPSAAWGTLKSFYLLDGNLKTAADHCLYGGDLNAPTTVGTGSGPVFAAHDLSVHQG